MRDLKKVSVHRGVVATFWVCALLALAGINAFSQAPSRLEIKTLSSRPDLVSGGDALVEIKAPAGVSLNDITVTFNGKDVTTQFKRDPDSGGFRGLITGMAVGDNSLRAVFKWSGEPCRQIRQGSPSEPLSQELSDNRTDSLGAPSDAIRVPHGRVGIRATA